MCVCVRRDVSVCVCQGRCIGVCVREMYWCACVGVFVGGWVWVGGCGCGCVVVAQGLRMLSNLYKSTAQLTHRERTN